MRVGVAGAGLTGAVQWGLPAALITEAVLESATTDQRVDVPARELMEVAP